MATCAHMPYLPNLSTPEDEGYDKSIKSMIEEVKRCDKLGIPYLSNTSWESQRFRRRKWD